MKKIILKTALTLLTFTFLLSTVKAQSPEKINYQAVIRNASNQLVSNTSVGMQISILQTSVTGAAVYVETQNPTTNANGLVTIEIGTGTVVSGDFSTINWANGPFFIKIEIDINGGNNYTITGTGQLMSVPYALHAKTAESITGGSSGHYVGELYGGGIVFYVYDNGQHGLIASLDDLDGGSGVAWSATDDVEIGASAKSMTDGAGNTAAIVAQDATAGYAATLCNSYTGGTQTDWYLPASWELNLLYNSAFIINKILENDGNGTTNGFAAEYVGPTYGRYWSSTEDNNNKAWYYDFYNGYLSHTNKFAACSVRAVRAF